MPRNHVITKIFFGTFSRILDLLFEASKGRRSVWSMWQFYLGISRARACPNSPHELLHSIRKHFWTLLYTLVFLVRILITSVIIQVGTLNSKVKLTGFLELLNSFLIGVFFHSPVQWVKKHTNFKTNKT